MKTSSSCFLSYIPESAFRHSEILNSAQSVFVTFLINSIDAIALLFTKQECMHKG